MVRIGFLISGSLDALTGGYIYDRQLVEYLRQNGHRVELIHLPDRNYLGRLWHSPWLSLSRQLNNFSPDILLQDELDHPSLVLANRRLKSHLGCPIVSIVHHLRCSEKHPIWHKKIYSRIEKLYLMSVDGFIFNSQTTCGIVENLVGKLKPKVIAYPCGNRLSVQITESEIIDRAKTPGPLHVVFLGNLIRRKALDVLLTALARLPNSPNNSYFLTIIGDLSLDKTYVRAIQVQIQKNKLSEKVTFTGTVTDSELAVRLKQNHILVIPSSYEGFGIAYLEGMGFGLPAIGTTAGGANEIITHGQNGFLVPVGDWADISTYLHELCEDRDLLASMSLKALQRFRSHPTWQFTGENILNFLNSMQRQSSPRESSLAQRV